MVIATLTALFILFGGSDLGHYLTSADKDIKQVVIEKDRRDAVLEVTKQLSKSLKKEHKRHRELVEQWLTLHEDYESTGEDFDKRFELVIEQQQTMIDAALDAREQMRSQMTAEEWETVFKGKEDATVPIF